MAKTSGSNSNRPPSTGGLKGGDANYKGGVGKLDSLVKIKDPQVYKSVKQSISRYHSVMGVRQREVKIGDLPNGVGGVHLTQGGQSKLVVLNKGLFNTNTNQVTSWANTGYKSGHLTKTNKPISHIVTHELSHATWNQHMTSPKATAAGKEIKSLYTAWSKDKKKSGYGSYAKTNVSEFFAEATTKAVHGKADKYTRKIKSIVKKYEL